MSLKERFSNAWNAFQTEPDRRADTNTGVSYTTYGTSSYLDASQHRLQYGNDRSILNTIFNRIANDIASVQIQHIRVDENGSFPTS